MKKGFTLIEVIISIALVCILILAIAGLSVMSAKTAQTAKERDEVFNIARSICEIYKSNSSFYSSPGSEVNIYKYINNVSDIEGINSLINNRDGYYSESNFNQIINANQTFKYTLILKIKRISSDIDMETLSVEAVKNDGKITRIKLTAAK
jgi:prepilin-type N-terminal cleavage/methylation domain-containing protein